MAALVAVGCFQPQFQAGVACSTEGTCPPGLTCQSGRCVTPGSIGGQDGSVIRDAGRLDGPRGDGPRRDGPGDGPRRDGPRPADGPLLRDAAASPRCDPTASFGTAALVPELSSPGQDFTSTFSADGLTLYLSSDRTGGTGGLDIYAATRTTLAAPFATPVRLVELGAMGADYHLTVSADGHTAFFVSDRSGTLELWRATRAGTTGPFQGPASVSSMLGGATGSYLDPVIAGNELIYSWNGPGSAMRDLWVAPFDGSTGALGQPSLVASVGSAMDEFGPSLTGDTLRLYFTTSRAGTFDIMEATRPSTVSAFSAPVTIAIASSTQLDEREPAISPDGCELFFTRATPGPTAAHDIFVARRPSPSPRDGGPPADACAPTTCAARAAQCGSIPNGCGATLACGACPGAQTCGARMANKCACASYTRVNTEVPNCNSDSAADYQHCIDAGNSGGCSSSEFEGWCRRGSNGAQSWFDVNRARMDARCPGTISFVNFVFTCHDETMCIEYYANVG